MTKTLQNGRIGLLRVLRRAANRRMRRALLGLGLGLGERAGDEPSVSSGCARQRARITGDLHAVAGLKRMTVGEN